MRRLPPGGHHPFPGIRLRGVRVVAGHARLHPGACGRAAAEENWASFVQDTEGMRSFREDYARAGVKVMKIESVYTDATEYSALR